MEVDPVTLAPSDRLDEGLLEWASSLGVHGLKTMADFFESSQNEVLLHVETFMVSKWQWGLGRECWTSYPSSKIINDKKIPRHL